MLPMNKNAVRLAQMLELTKEKTQKLFDVIGLSDLAALTTAINNDDMDTVKSIYLKYADQINDLPGTEVVKGFYDNLIAQGRDENAALADTADHFGITGESVHELLGNQEESVKMEEPFIPDHDVREAYKNIQEMLKGGKSKKLVCELSMWQRKMMYGLVPATVSAVCQKTLDMTPIALMQKQAEIAGLAEAMLGEMSLHEMIENIIEYELNNLNEAQINQFGDDKYGPWELKWTLKPTKNGKFAGAAYNSKVRDKASSQIEVTTDKLSDFPQALINAINADAGSQKIEPNDKVTIDFNGKIRTVIDQTGELFADIEKVNGKPTLIVSKTDLGGMKRTADRRSIKSKMASDNELRAFSMSGKKAIEAGLDNARYSIGDGIDYIDGAEAYPLTLVSKVIHGQPENHDEPGITVAVTKNVTKESAELIKSIVNKKF